MAETIVAPVKKSGKVVRARWSIMLSLMVLTMFNYFDRINIAFVAPIFHKTYGISSVDLGWIFAAWALGFFVFAIPTSKLADSRGPKTTLSIFATIWALACVGLGFLANTIYLFMMRLFLGVGESPAFPITTKFAGQWFKEGSRGVPIGVNGFGLGLGLIVGPLFAIYLLKSFGWPWVFFGTGLVTLLWVVVLRLVLSNSPSKYRGMSNKDVTALDAEVGKGHSKNADSGEILKVRSFLSYPSTWGIIFGVFGIIYVQFFFLNWLPSYLVSVRHFTVIKSIFYTIIPSIGAAIGALLGGFLTDGLVRITKDHKLIARKIPFFALALLVALFQVPALLSPSPLVAVAVVAVINFMIQWGLVIIHTISIRIAGNRSAASFDSFVQVVFGLGAFASALFTGYLIHYSGFNGAAGISTIIGVITAVIFVILYRDIRLAKNPADEPQVPAAA